MKEESSWMFAFGLLVTFGLLVLFRENIDAITALFVKMRSEYRTLEQLTKFALLLTMAFTFLCLKIERDKDKLLPAALMMALAMTLYLSESNMIEGNLQPLFGAILILPCLFCLLRGKYYKELIVFVAGLSVIAVGVLNDMLKEIEQVKALFPELIANWILSFHEEFLDTIGACLVSAAACILAGNVLLEVARKKPVSLLVLLLAMCLVAVGNGLAHYQYKPSTALLTVAFFMSLIGMIVLLSFRRITVIRETGSELYDVKEYRLDAFLVFFFVLMPVFLHDYNYSISTVLWIWIVYAARASYHRALKRFDASAAG